MPNAQPAVFTTTPDAPPHAVHRPEPVWRRTFQAMRREVDEVVLPVEEARQGRLDQDAEWCELVRGNHRRRIRFHDYHEIYNVPGLYEALFYDKLACTSPSRVTHLLQDVMADAGEAIEGVGFLDVGAGNGMVAEELQHRGAGPLVGVDIIPEARDAAHRDRPGLYDDYVVADLTDLPEADERRIRKHRLRGLTTVAALGFGDIPAAAFIKALDLVETPAWIAFNVKDTFLKDHETTGFGGLVNELLGRGVLQMESYRRYGHRLSVAGDQLHYVGMIAKKLKDVPDDLLNS